MDKTVKPFVLPPIIAAPPSKSEAHRLFICCCAYPPTGSVTEISINGEPPDDLNVTIACLKALGARIEIKTKSFSGVTYTVSPIEKKPERVRLDCGESGSTLRFLLPLAAALGIDADFFGSPRLAERPIQPLVKALEKHGRVYLENGFPCVRGDFSGGDFVIDGSLSSQFASGLLLALPLFGGSLTVTGSLVSRPYMTLTAAVMKNCGVEVFSLGDKLYTERVNMQRLAFFVSGDWSAAAFWLCAGAIGGRAAVTGISFGLQGDEKIVSLLSEFGAEVKLSDDGSVTVKKAPLHGIEISVADIPDLAPPLAVVAAFASGETVIRDTERLKYKESDRAATISELLVSLGGRVTAEKNRLIIYGKPLTGGTVNAHGDHRIAMAAAVAACGGGTVCIKGAECVSKSYPDFFRVTDR